MLFGMERARVCAFSLQSFHNLIIYKDTIQKRHAVFFSMGCMSATIFRERQFLRTIASQMAYG